MRLPALLAALLLAAPARAQPHEEGSFRPPDLVEIIRLDSTVHLDIRYATANNFMKRPMYPEARAFLQRPAAEALLRVQGNLRKKGLGLLVMDAYRPWSVTKKFWDETPPAQRSFVADPAKGSLHNRGCAVDCTLYALADGKPVPMPSAYDEFSPRASPFYTGGTALERRMRWILRSTMEAAGFSVDSGEWWHYDYKEWRHYRVMDVPFSAIH